MDRPKINSATMVSYQEIVDHLPIAKLTNTPTNTFWWKPRTATREEFAERFPHEKARTGQCFVDGNNGDRWRVIAVNPRYKRIVVRNLTQDLNPKLVYWD